jgi:hypothetical protein
MVISDGISAVPRKRKFSEFLSEPFRGTKINANSRNSRPNPSAEEITTWNFTPWNKNRSKLSEFPSKPSEEEKTPRNSFPWNEKQLRTKCRSL